MTGVRRAPRSLTMPIAASALLHVAVIAPFILLRAAPAPILPPMYKVNLIAAPAGPRAAGVVTEAPAPVAPAPPPPKATPKPAPAKAPPKARPAKAPVRATPTIAPKAAATPVTEAPKAGGGERGGRGTDVVSVSTEGINFPYKGYLDNIVRQIALNFSPRGNVGALRAEVFFFIRRDGSTFGFKFLTRSGNMAFDLEAQGAVEAAARAFGALPAGFADDVLPVYFYFDPNRLK